MDVRTVLVGLLALAPCVASHLAPRTIIHPSNASATTALPSATTSHSTSDCCFIVQDTVYEEWWLIYSISTLYEPINLTSITTLVTPYINGTVTNYETNVYPTSASSFWTRQLGQDPVTLYPHAAPGPVQKDTRLDTSNGGQIVTAGVTVTSPAAFWAYSTVKVINVPAVTDSNGQLVCATTSVLGRNVPTIFTSTFSGINSNAEAYFGGYDIGLPARAARNISAPSYSGITITFPTPYIYEPTRGANGATGEGNTDGCWFTGLKEDYGYVPSSVVKYVTDHPDIVSQYPGITSCLPGGPSILYVSTCAIAAPEINFSATDLTEHTVVTVGSGAPSPAPANAPAITANLAAPGNAPLQQSQVVAFTPAPTPPVLTPLAPTPAVPTPAVPTPPAPTPPAPPPPANAPPQGTVEGVVSPAGTAIQPVPQPPAAKISATGAAIPPGSQPPPALTAIVAAGTAIPSGAQPPLAQTSGGAIIPGQSSLVITGPTTIPVNPANPLPGSTTTISSTPFVVIPSPTTIVFPPSATAGVPLPSGQTTSIGGTPVVIISGIQTVPVNSAFSVSGATTVVGGVTTAISGTPTVVGGTTEVVVSGTVAIVLPTNLQGTATPSKPAQLTGGAAPAYNFDAWLRGFLGIFVWVFVL